MKKITGLDEQFHAFGGVIIEKDLTLKVLLIRVLFNSKAKPDIAIRISTKIIPMLQADKHSGEFEDADFNMMKDVVLQNDVDLPIGLLGSLVALFNEPKNNTDTTPAKPTETPNPPQE